MQPHTCCLQKMCRLIHALGPGNLLIIIKCSPQPHPKSPATGMLQKAGSHVWPTFGLQPEGRQSSVRSWWGWCGAPHKISSASTLTGRQNGDGSCQTSWLEARLLTHLGSLDSSAHSDSSMLLGERNATGSRAPMVRSGTSTKMGWRTQSPQPFCASNPDGRRWWNWLVSKIFLNLSSQNGKPSIHRDGNWKQLFEKLRNQHLVLNYAILYGTIWSLDKLPCSPMAYPDILWIFHMSNFRIPPTLAPPASWMSLPVSVSAPNQKGMAFPTWARSSQSHDARVQGPCITVTS